MTKMKPETWASLPYSSKQAYAVYADKVPSHLRQGMIDANPEQATALRNRMGNVEPAPSSCDRVPGLKRVEVKATKSWWER